MNTLCSPRAALFLAVLLIAPLASGVAPTPDEIATARQWAAAKFHARPEAPTPPLGLSKEQTVSRTPGVPFAFLYDGRPSAELLAEWPLKQSARDLSQNKTERTLTWTDRKTGLQVRCEAVEYHDFPTVEWTLYFKNTGTSATPILENIDALNLALERGTNGEFLLHHNIGSPANGSDYGPLETPLGPKATKRIGAAGGRPTNSDWSYFNLEWPGQGVILAVGWPGQWAAEFTRDEARGLRIHGGPGTYPFQAPARRRGPQPADRAPVLEGRLASRAEPLAPLDDGPFHAQTRRQASATPARRLQLAPIR